MQHFALGRRPASAAAAILSLSASLLAASVANAQPRGTQLLYEWQGRVDHEVQIFPGRGGFDVRGIGGAENPGRFRNTGGPPRGPGQISVQRLSGRGNVDVIGNNVVRIRDPQGGADFYRVRVFWQPNGGQYGRGDGRNGAYDNGNNGGYNDRDRRPHDDRRPFP
ncbi:MAG TPA: hypothetical protein VGD56_22105 [Gemmatirosa sp.]